MATILYMTDFTESYARGLLMGMSEYIHHIGEAWNIRRLPREANYDIRDIVKYAKHIKADAIIGQFNIDDDLKLFAEAGIIAIAQEFKERFDYVPNIIGEYYKAGCLGATYLINRGFQHFGFYGIKGVIWSEERFSGFRDTILKANRSYTLSDLNLPEVDIWNYEQSEIEQWIASLPKPVAIMGCDDTHAFNLSEACRLMQYKSYSALVRVPQDVAILGVDNDEVICTLSSPMLSSIDQDEERGGWRVARLIHDILSGRQKYEEASNLIVPITSIITRQSTDIFVNEDENISKVLRYIHKNINCKINVDDIVREVPLSRRLLETRFMSAIGTSIYDYVLRVRIDKIAERLLQGSSVSDAAFELGFNDVKNLSRVFKRIKGVSPSDYKKSMLK